MSLAAKIPSVVVISAATKANRNTSMANGEGTERPLHPLLRFRQGLGWRGRFLGAPRHYIPQYLEPVVGSHSDLLGG